MDYYYFYNISRDLSNKHIIPGYGNHNCVFQLYQLDDDEIKKLFQQIIRINKWERHDEISAASANEDNAVILYHHNELQYFNALDDREGNLPPDDMDVDEPIDAADHDHNYLLAQLSSEESQENYSDIDIDDVDE